MSEIFYIYLSIGLILMIAEMFALTSFFLMGTGIAVVIVGFLSLIIDSLTAQLILIGVLSAVIVFSIKKMNIFKENTEYKSNVDSYIGHKVEIIEESSEKKYSVKIFGEIWNAYSEELLVEDRDIVVEKVNGSRLLIKNKKEND